MHHLSVVLLQYWVPHDYLQNCQAIALKHYPLTGDYPQKGGCLAYLLYDEDTDTSLAEKGLKLFVA